MKAILGQCRVDVLDPHLIVGEHASILIDTLVDDHLIATAFATTLYRSQRLGNARIEIRVSAGNQRQPRRAGGVDALCAKLERLLADSLNQALGPRFGIACVAAFQQQQ